MKQKLMKTLTYTPQTRSRLCEVLGISDRRLRRLIAELRAEGKPVCSSSKIPGYWIGQGDDVTVIINDLRSRGLALLEQANRMQIQRQIDGQKKMDIYP